MCPAFTSSRRDLFSKAIFEYLKRLLPKISGQQQVLGSEGTLTPVLVYQDDPFSAKKLQRERRASQNQSKTRILCGTSLTEAWNGTGRDWTIGKQTKGGYMREVPSLHTLKCL
ncbi:hypothetical protein MPTK2_2g14850 [Marchantia polymorpha subsp. ruderalis]